VTKRKLLFSRPIFGRSSDARGEESFSVMNGLLRHRPRKGKPVARPGRKAKGRAAGFVVYHDERYGSPAAERMLAVADRHAKAWWRRLIAEMVPANAR
jgi:hypothetical protein